MSVSLDCALRRNEEMIFTELGDTVVMMNPDTGIYYELDPLGARIWSLLRDVPSVTRLCDALVREYDVSPEVCRRDVLEFVERALGLQIVQVAAPAAP